MGQFEIWKDDYAKVVARPNAFPVTRLKIDLSIERSDALKNNIVWPVGAALFLRNAADADVGGVQVSTDSAATKLNLGNNNFFLSAGDSVNIPHVQVVISNRPQPNKFAYLESSQTVQLNTQTITDVIATAGDLDVLNKATAGGVTLPDVQGEYDGAFKKRDFLMASDESQESSNREWMKNLKKGALINPTGNVFWRNYVTGFNQLARVLSISTNYSDAYLTSAQTGTIMGGNVGFDAFYKLKFYVNFRDTTGQSVEVVDSGLYFGGGAFAEIRPRKTIITSVKTSGLLTISNAILEYPVIVIPANRTNDMVLGLIFSPSNTLATDFDMDFACQWQRIEQY